MKIRDFAVEIWMNRYETQCELNIAENLTLKGYVCMSINYKLRKISGQVTWPQNLHDCNRCPFKLHRSAFYFPRNTLKYNY